MSEYRCPNCESTNWREKNEEGDTFWECLDCGETIENGVLVRKGKKIDIYNAEHPSRQKAIKILEHIASYMGNDDMFDCNEKTQETTWYDLEDTLTLIIEGKEI